MADTAAAQPQTPPRKLFKASSSVKAPTPVRRPESPATTSPKQSSGHQTAPPKPRSEAGDTRRRLFSSGTTSPKLVRKFSTSTTGSTSRAALEDIRRSTTLAPLDDASETSRVKPSRYAASEAASESPIALIDRDLRDSATGSAQKPAESARGEEVPSKTLGGGTDAITKAREGLTQGIGSAQEQITDLAKYFTDRGHTEMGHFFQALSAPRESEPEMGSRASKAGESKAAASKGSKQMVLAETADNFGVSTDPIDELPTDDTLVRDAPTGDGAAGNRKESANKSAKDTKPATGNATKNVAETARDTTETVTETAGNASGKDGAADTQNKTENEGAQGAKPNTTRTNAETTTKDSSKPSESKESPTHVFDNYGKPAQINKTVEMPLPPPKKQADAGGEKEKEVFADLSGVASVDKLKGTDDLADTNGLEDPPEEFLDPEVHSPKPSANISPIPKVGKVEPIGSKPPPNLFRLANGLGGYTVDDVGSIVDESGKVLGHATGDLPAMVGKKVANNGEVYGDGGELIGYVTENFTGHPPPPQPEGDDGGTPLPGNLRVDWEGNIRDASGNILGKMNKPAQSNALTHYTGAGDDSSRPKQANPQEQSGKQPPREEGGGDDQSKDKEKFNNGIPADIFLDVKSTPDGIQLTIRIPTVFKQEPRQPEAA